jgi:hypothetical protein
MTTDKSTILRGFNNHFFEFIDEIINVFPENQDVKNARTTCDLIKKANPTAIIKAWQIFVYEKYKDVIESENMDFFFEKDYSQDLVYMQNSGDIMKSIDVIREPLKNLSKESKETSLVYIKNLCKLSNMYNVHKH